YHETLELVRFLLFFFVTSTFFLGTAHFFEEVHGPDSATAYPADRKRFELDFMMGLIHFMIFFGWSSHLANHRIWLFGLTPSYLFVLAVFAYDLVWFAISTDLSTHNMIGKWSGLSVLTVILSFLCFVLVRTGYEAGESVLSWRFDREVASTSAEFVALMPV